MDNWLEELKKIDKPEISALMQIMLLCDMYIVCDEGKCSDCNLLRKIKDIAHAGLNSECL